MYQIIFIYAFIYRNYLTVVLIQHNIKSDIRTRFKDLDVSILVEHTAQHPNSCPVVQALALYGLGRIDSGGTLVERDAPNPNHRGSDKISMSMGYEKDIFGSLRMNSNPQINHGESRVYHQFHRNCISSKRSFVYHHCEKKCSLRLMIYTFGDEMHACA